MKVRITFPGASPELQAMVDALAAFQDFTDALYAVSDADPERWERRKPEIDRIERTLKKQIADYRYMSARKQLSQ